MIYLKNMKNICLSAKCLVAVILWIFCCSWNAFAVSYYSPILSACPRHPYFDRMKEEEKRARIKATEQKVSEDLENAFRNVRMLGQAPVPLPTVTIEVFCTLNSHCLDAFMMMVHQSSFDSLETLKEQYKVFTQDPILEKFAQFAPSARANLEFIENSQREIRQLGKQHNVRADIYPMLIESSNFHVFINVDQIHEFFSMKFSEASFENFKIINEIMIPVNKEQPVALRDIVSNYEQIVVVANDCLGLPQSLKICVDHNLQVLRKSLQKSESDPSFLLNENLCTICYTPRIFAGRRYLCFWLISLHEDESKLFDFCLQYPDGDFHEINSHPQEFFYVSSILG